MICSVVRKRVVTVQQEVEPGGFLQLFNRSTSGRERASCDHGTMICQQNSVMLMRNSSHCLSELLVAWAVVRDQRQRADFHHVVSGDGREHVRRTHIREQETATECVECRWTIAPALARTS